jgi:GTP-binding protein
MNKLRERLQKEKRANISLKIEEVAGRDDAIRVCGRGELHLAVLIEAMRREGFEMALSKPKVITKTVDGVLMEPMERVHVEVPEQFSGTVIEDLSKRKGEMRSLETSEHGLTTMQFLVPTRGLMGYRNDFLTRTSGLGVLTSIFEIFAPWKGDMAGRLRGVMISNTGGKANGYGLFNLQERGALFVKPGDEVYEGMVVGEHARDNDIVVNATKAKQLTNVRAAGSDENIILTPPRKFTLEQAIDYIEDDELVEVTPNFIRLRKTYLTENERKRFSRN